MARSAEAQVNPEILIWARENTGYTKESIANKLKIPVERLEDWEVGKKLPTMVQLRKLANYYKYPIATFYLFNKPEGIPPIHDFRRIEIGEEFKEPVQLRLAIREAISRREIALELRKELNIEPPEFPYIISITDNPEEVGEKIRDILSIDINKQLNWGSKYEPLNRWRTAVENIGVLVFQITGVDIDEMRGFAISEFPLPVIGFNGGDTINGRIFTLIHELTHLMLHESGICDIYEYYRRQEKEGKIEVFCNHVAGATLLPKHILLNDIIVRNKTGAVNWSDNDLRTLANKYKTSRETALRRLLILGRTTIEFYQRKREEYIQEYLNIKEKEKKGKNTPVPVFRKVISHNGVPFVNLVLDSYYQEKITSSDLSDFLQAKLKHLLDIETEAKNKTLKYGVLL